MRRRQLAGQVRLTQHTYCSYLQHTRYPHASRPAAQHPDQLYPNQPVRESNPMRVDGGDSDPGVLVQTAQSRVYLAAGETVEFSLRAVDAHGAALPLVVTRALVQGMVAQGARPAPSATLAFQRMTAATGAPRSRRMRAHWRAFTAPSAAKCVSARPAARVSCCSM